MHGSGGGHAPVSLSIIIPVSPPGLGKSRLAPALSSAQRAALTIGMFRRVLDAALAVGAGEACFVVSRSEQILDMATSHGARAVAETGNGQNQALDQAARLVAPDFPLLALSADLPRIAAEDLLAMRGALAPGAVVIAADRAGQGCNALLQPRPGCIPFLFGADSLARHSVAGQSAGLIPRVIARDGLSSDIDVPHDLALLDGELATFMSGGTLAKP